MYSLCCGLAGFMLRKIKCQARDMKRSRYVEHGWELVNIVLPGVLPTQAVFQLRDAFRVKNPTTSTTWTDTDENDSRLRYFYKLKYYTLSDPLRNCMTPCRKKLTGTLLKEAKTTPLLSSQLCLVNLYHRCCFAMSSEVANENAKLLFVCSSIKWRNR